MVELNTVYCENCLDTMQNMDCQSIDLVVTSPPYDNLRDYKGYSFDYRSVISSLYRVLKIGGVVVWIVGDSTVNGSKTGNSFRHCLYFQEVGFNIHDTMIWNKGSFTAVGALKSKYAPVYEFMFILSKGRPKTFNPIKDRKNKYAGYVSRTCFRNQDGSMKYNYSTGRTISEYGQRFNIWDIYPDRQNRTGHPAVFPENLARDHIISWSNEGDIVYDPFMGSGTTAIACIRSNRIYLGSEISPEYCNIAKDRILKCKSSKK